MASVGDWLRRVLRVGPAGGVNPWLALIPVFIVWLASGSYRLHEGERGVVQRWGRYITTELPGQGWRLPWPIETITPVDVTTPMSVQFSDDDLVGGGLVDISARIRYRAVDPANFIFHADKSDVLVKQVAQTALRMALVNANLGGVLRGEARPLVASETIPRIQRYLDAMQLGIAVLDVTITDATLPGVVHNNERAALEANVQRTRDVDDARNEGEASLAAARADNIKAMTEANSYAADAVSRAQGDAAHFMAMLPAYEQAPDITRHRLYTDAIGNILAHSRKIVLDGHSAAALGLPADKLVEILAAPPTGKAAAAPAPAPGSTPAAPGAVVGAPAAAATSPAAAHGADGDGRALDRDRQADRTRERL